MPPKPKFTREEIVAAALELVSEKGMSALTSRDLGARLGSSARPIFTMFNSMEEVQEAVHDAAIVIRIPLATVLIRGSLGLDGMWIAILSNHLIASGGFFTAGMMERTASADWYNAVSVVCYIWSKHTI